MPGRSPRQLEDPCTHGTMATHMAMLIPLQVKSDNRGVLAVMECGEHVPFVVRRAFVIAAMPEGARRGAHAHRAQHQFLVATAGAITVIADDGSQRQTWRLEGPTHGIHAPPMTWLDLCDPSPGSSLLVLCDAPYLATDYIHDESEFRRLAGS